MTDRPARRGFLAACSAAAAAALGLTFKARPVEPPPRGIDPPPGRLPTFRAGERLRADDFCYLKCDGLVYASRPSSRSGRAEPNR
jgi:hypothetical protein